MYEHYYFKSAEHYANFLRSVLRDGGIGVDDLTYQSFIDMFEVAKKFGIFTGVSDFSWQVKNLLSEGFSEDAFVEIKSSYKTLMATVSNYKAFKD